eukprot:749180-Hanusia_phi.AAC.2
MHVYVGDIKVEKKLINDRSWTSTKNPYLRLLRKEEYQEHQPDTGSSTMTSLVALDCLLADTYRRFAVSNPAQMQLGWDCAKSVGTSNRPPLRHLFSPEEIKTIPLSSGFSSQRQEEHPANLQQRKNLP